MSLSRTVRLTMLGFSLLPAACAGATDEDMVHEIAAPYAEPLTDDNGNGGNNGLRCDFFHASKYRVLSATAAPLPGVGDVLSNNLLTLISSEGGDKTFQYATGCGLHGDDVVSYVDQNNAQKSYFGGGLLGSTQGWLDASLNSNQRGDLFACMLARLNPYGIPIPIALTGAAVAPPVGAPFDMSGYTFEEALWTASVGSTGALIFRVWPLGDLHDLCTAVDDALRTRVCGTSDGDCGLEIRHNFTQDCQGADGVFTCLGQDAIMTRLDPGDADLLHSMCVVQ